MNNILKMAIKEACKSDVIRGKIGAVAYTKNGHIVSKAHNSTFLGSDRIRTIHAEEALLQKIYNINAIERYGELNILVIRYKPGTKELAIAKPCISCQRSLLKTRIRTFYTTEIGNIEELDVSGR